MSQRLCGELQVRLKKLERPEEIEKLDRSEFGAAHRGKFEVVVFGKILTCGIFLAMVNLCFLPLAEQVAAATF